MDKGFQEIIQLYYYKNLVLNRAISQIDRKTSEIIQLFIFWSNERARV